MRDIKLLTELCHNLVNYSADPHPNPSWKSKPFYEHKNQT
jgi:hypothetical protein